VTDWRIEGEYAEVCNCDFLCPCLPTFAAARPTYGDCRVAQLYDIRKGHFGDVSLDGLRFVMVALTPEAMSLGNWTFGLFVDQRATDAQTKALSDIGVGNVGGPPARWKLLTSRFMGVEKRPIEFEIDGLTRRVRVPGLVEYEVEGIASRSRPGEPMCIDNVSHTAGIRLALGHAKRALFKAFGIDWIHTAGTANGHFTRFAWSNL
jgi:hypothetical protein